MNNPAAMQMMQLMMQDPEMQTLMTNPEASPPLDHAWMHVMACSACVVWACAIVDRVFGVVCVTRGCWLLTGDRETSSGNVRSKLNHASMMQHCTDTVQRLLLALCCAAAMCAVFVGASLLPFRFSPS